MGLRSVLNDVKIVLMLLGKVSFGWVVTIKDIDLGIHFF
jgi:hypothetical protein